MYKKIAIVAALLISLGLAVLFMTLKPTTMPTVPALVIWSVFTVIMCLVVYVLSFKHGAKYVGKKVRITIGILAVLSISVSGAAVAMIASSPIQKNLISESPSTNNKLTNNDMNEETVLKLINRERSKVGLNELRNNPELKSAACKKLDHMLAYKYWSHELPDGTSPWKFISDAGYEYSNLGENLAYGYSTEVALVEGWMKSSEHKDNILGDYEDSGVCIRKNIYEGKPQSLIVNMFGSSLTTLNQEGNQIAPESITDTDIDETRRRADDAWVRASESAEAARCSSINLNQSSNYYDRMKVINDEYLVERQRIAEYYGDVSSPDYINAHNQLKSHINNRLQGEYEFYKEMISNANCEPSANAPRPW